MGGNPPTPIQPGSDQGKPTPPNREAIAFTERAIFQCMGMSPKVAGQMAKACNGIYDSFKSGKYGQYLPKVSFENSSQHATAQLDFGNLDAPAQKIEAIMRTLQPVLRENSGSSQLDAKPSGFSDKVAKLPALDRSELDAAPSVFPVASIKQTEQPVLRENSDSSQLDAKPSVLPEAKVSSDSQIAYARLGPTLNTSIDTHKQAVVSDKLAISGDSSVQQQKGPIEAIGGERFNQSSTAATTKSQMLPNAETLIRNQVGTPETITPTTNDSLVAANNKETSRLATAFTGVGTTGIQDIQGVQRPAGADATANALPLDKQLNLARTSISETQVAQLLNSLQNNLGNNFGASLNDLGMQSRLFNLFNPAQGGLVARDNNVALSEALIGPLGTPVHPSFAFATNKVEIPAAIGNALSVKESPAGYTPSTAATSNLANVAPGTLAGKDAPAAPNAANTQAIVQAFQGILQPGQGAVKGAEEAGKAIVKGGGPGLPDALTTNQGTGKKGAEGLIEGTSTPLMPLPTTLTGKGGKGIEGGDDAKLPIGQATNPAQNTLIVTATAGAQITGQTGAAGTQTGATGTSGTVTGTAGTAGKDPNSTDIKSLVGALPAVEIYDSKQEVGEAEEVAETRKEINYDSIDDDDEDDDLNNLPIVDGKRASSASAVPSKKPKSKPWLSIIENIMVLINDLKNKPLDDKTEQQMLTDLFIDIFNKKERDSCPVRVDDTLYTIAHRVLKEPRLTPLLYTINVHAKHIAAIKDQENIQAIYEIRPETTTILLPFRSEILRYKIHVLKDPTALTLYTRGIDLDKEFTIYTCRDGDTIESIAKNHIDLQDEGRWIDIALLNGLSVRLNKKGTTLIKLKSGQKLKIPKPVLAEDEDEDEDDLLSAAGNENCDKLIPEIPVSLDFNSQDEESVNKALSTIEKRIVSQSDLDAQTVLMELEIIKDNRSIKIVEWDINPIASTLKLFDKSGFTKVIPIALPTRAARELAENDLKLNAGRYCELFLKDQLAA